MVQEEPLDISQIWRLISGTAKDDTGAGLPEASSPLTKTETGAERKPATDDAGRYAAPSIAAGRTTCGPRHAWIVGRLPLGRSPTRRGGRISACSSPGRLRYTERLAANASCFATGRSSSRAACGASGEACLLLPVRPSRSVCWER